MRVWCEIVICGAIGTEGSGNYELSGVGVCTRGCFCVVLGVGWKLLLAITYMVWKLEREKSKRRVHGGKSAGGEIVRDFLTKLHSNYFRAVLFCALIDYHHLSVSDLK